MRPETIEELRALELGLPAADGSGLFGANIPIEDAALVIIPVPWEATTSYGGGTAQGPRAVLRASHQLDLYDRMFGAPYWRGITMLPEAAQMHQWNEEAKTSAQSVIRAWSEERPDSCQAELQRVNVLSRQVDQWVLEQSRQYLKQGKHLAVLGGDHSSPLGLIQALSEVHPDGFGILHLDAHMDLRRAYEGFERSHASIMYNVMEEVPEVKRLVAIGVRDFSGEEVKYADSQGDRVIFYDDGYLQSKLCSGVPFSALVDDLLRNLPQKVYCSFDIDGLDPSLCPNTGTPVPGGLSYGQLIYLLDRLALSGKTIIGFDLCEVVGHDEHEWNANVGARVLYKMCGALLYSLTGERIVSGR